MTHHRYFNMDYRINRDGDEFPPDQCPDCKGPMKELYEVIHPHRSTRSKPLQHFGSICEDCLIFWFRVSR